MLVINRSDVLSLLPMTEAVLAMSAAMTAISQGDIEVPQRQFIPLGRDGNSFGLMPVAANAPPVFGLKAISLFPENPTSGLPAIQGFVSLFDQETGEPKAIIDGVSITAIRTAASSGLATRELARRDVRTHGILGTGVQAVAHAEAILSVRPDIEQTYIWGRSRVKARELAAQLSHDLNHPVSAGSREEAAGCDVISAVTGSATPVIESDQVSDGSHINLVGSHTPDKREACSELIARGRVFVDLRSSALIEAGDVLIPLREGKISEAHILGEIGEVISRKIDGRRTTTDVTIYKSLGNAAQDLFAAAWILEAALSKDVGQRVEF